MSLQDVPLPRDISHKGGSQNTETGDGLSFTHS